MGYYCIQNIMIEWECLAFHNICKNRLMKTEQYGYKNKEQAA